MCVSVWIALCLTLALIFGRNRAVFLFLCSTKQRSVSSVCENEWNATVCVLSIYMCVWSKWEKSNVTKTSNVIQCQCTSFVCEQLVKHRRPLSMSLLWLLLATVLFFACRYLMKRFVLLRLTVTCYFRGCMRRNRNCNYYFLFSCMLTLGWGSRVVSFLVYHRNYEGVYSLCIVHLCPRRFLSSYCVSSEKREEERDKCQWQVKLCPDRKTLTCLNNKTKNYIYIESCRESKRGKNANDGERPTMLLQIDNANSLYILFLVIVFDLLSLCLQVHEHIWK